MIFDVRNRLLDLLPSVVQSTAKGLLDSKFQLSARVRTLVETLQTKLEGVMSCDGNETHLQVWFVCALVKTEQFKQDAFTFDEPINKKTFTVQVTL